MRKSGLDGCGVGITSTFHARYFHVARAWPEIALQLPTVNKNQSKFLT